MPLKPENDVKLLSGSGKLVISFRFSLIAGTLIFANAAAVAAAATWFPWIMPTLPGSSGNDAAVLYTVAAVGFICAVLVLVGAIMLRNKPEHKKAWGALTIAFSIPSVVTGGGFIIGFILGIIGGASAFSRK